MGCPGFSRFPDRFRHLSIPVSAVPPGSPRSWEELTPAVLYRDRDGMPGRTSRFPPRFPRVAPRFSRRLPGCSRVLPDSPQVAPEAFGLPDTRLPRFLPGGSGGFHGRAENTAGWVPGRYGCRFSRNFGGAYRGKVAESGEFSPIFITFRLQDTYRMLIKILLKY